MLITISLIISLVCTFLLVYYTEYVKTSSILGWTIPLYLLGFFIACLLVFIIGVSIYCLFVNKKKKILKPRREISFVTWVTCQFLMAFYGLKIIVEGKEKMPKDGKFLFVSNHQSMLDPIITISQFPQFIMTFIMKKEVMSIPIVGKWLYGAGFLPLDRQNNRSAIEVIVQAAKRCEAGYPVCVYPEGTRSKDTYVAEFRNGIFKVAQRAKAPIVVCTIDNVFRIKKRFPWRRTKIILKISDVISYEQIADMHTNDIGDMIRKTMQNDIETFRKENSWIGK